jgi:hypothetical protein
VLGRTQARHGDIRRIESAPRTERVTSDACICLNASLLLYSAKARPDYFIMSIMDYNGGSVVAMVGKDCVAIASDLRLGNQALGVASNFQKVNRRVRSVQEEMILSLDN